MSKSPEDYEPMATTSLDRGTSLSIFERMLMIRHFEEGVIRLYEEGRFVSHYHIYIGQEATSAAVIEALTDNDLICTTHRNHGHVIGRGSDPSRAMAEILGRAAGFNGGRGGTLHLCDADQGFLSTSAVVGGCAGLATGAAFGIKVKRESKVAVGFFGDGSLEEGLVIEAFNIAALWRLPVVYVCENNSAGALGPQQGGYPTAITAVQGFTQLPAAYGIHCVKVDGSDMAAVHAAAVEAVRRCRTGNGPVFIEAVTMRWPGSNPLWPELATVTDLTLAWEPERIGGQHADWLRHCDPLLRSARELVAQGHATRDELCARDSVARERIAAAMTFAIDSPMPEPESALQRVFA
ncbi:MAG: thiamine pyrophosphate-dependent dehydrogenase E1 component subunit alpha [Hyphomicrobiales bacterium]|nr:thiamine pyrophosphate-dependent dehydrogenase E1 component subunit alpha [Hyphomicrobiales bacterium]